MHHQDVLPTSRDVESSGVQHFLEGHGEFSLIRLCVVHSQWLRGDTQLRLGQEREGETIRRWCRRYFGSSRCGRRCPEAQVAGAEQRSPDRRPRPTPKYYGHSRLEWRILLSGTAAKNGPSEERGQPLISGVPALISTAFLERHVWRSWSQDDPSDHDAGHRSFAK